MVHFGRKTATPIFTVPKVRLRHGACSSSQTALTYKQPTHLKDNPCSYFVQELSEGL